MDSVLSPREIQTRIRSGASLDEVVAAAGLPADRVERFAAPVLAEREHVAAQARSSSVRRRGETSGHRTLRAVLADRLRARRVDIDTVAWDSYRMENGRWAISASYELASGPAGTPGAVEQHQAVFHYDLQGRFSVAANDQARWVLGETVPSAPGQEPTPDTEPTIDLSDDLAIVRAVQEQPVDPGALAEAEVLASVQPIRRGPRTAARSRRSEETPVVDTARAAAPQSAPPPPGPAERQPSNGPEQTRTGEAQSSTAAGATADQPYESQLDNLYAMLDGYGEDSPRVYAGLTELPAPETAPSATAPSATAPADTPGHTAGDTRGEAASPSSAPAEPVAVPESVAGRGAGWEPAIVVRYPVEPGSADDDGGIEVPEASDDPGRAEPPVAGEDREDEAEALAEEQESRSVPEVPSAPASTEPEPAEPEPAEPGLPEPGLPEPEVPEPEPTGPDLTEPYQPELEPEPEPEPASAPERQPAPGSEPSGDGERDEQREPGTTRAEPAGAALSDGAAPAPNTPAEAPSAAAEAQQTGAADGVAAAEAEDALIPAPSRPAATRTAARKKRASVPSWDEIMFGGPRKS